MNQGKECGEIRGSGQQSQHPDDEEVIRNDRPYFGQSYCLDADALEYLGVAQARENASSNVAGGLSTDLGEDNERGEEEGKECADDE